MKQLVFIFSCITVGIIVGGSVLAVKEKPSKALPPQEKQVVTEQPRGESPVKQGITPITLRIPKFGISAMVESVGMDKKGRMDVPKKDENVAWYNLGFKPGSLGSAVIAGHFDTVTGAPAVFYNLNKLTPGDQIIVTSSSGKDLIFKVTDKQLYPDASFPLQKVFNTTDKPRLNLITCDGVWNRATQNYSQRLVVFTELDSSSS